jgi:hypothetical protein
VPIALAFILPLIHSVPAILEILYVESGEMCFLCRRISSFAGLCWKWLHSLISCIVWYCIRVITRAVSVQDPLHLGICIHHSLLCLLVYMPDIHSWLSSVLPVHLRCVRCNIYLIPVFWVTPFSICGLPGCVYWVVCFSYGSYSFHVCSPCPLLVSIIITSSRQLNSGSYRDVACSFSSNLNNVISSA